MLKLRWWVVVHVTIRTIVHRLRRWVSVAMSLRVGVASRKLMELMLVWRHGMITLLIRPVRLSEWRRRLTWMTIESFSRWRELIKMWWRHSIRSIHLRSGLLLWWLRNMRDRLPRHVSILRISIISMHCRWSRSAHLIMRLIGEVRVVVLRAWTLWWVLLKLRWDKHVWIAIWSTVVWPRLVLEVRRVTMCRTVGSR